MEGKTPRPVTHDGDEPGSEQEEDQYRDLELDELAHGIQQVLEHAIAEKDSSRDRLSHTHAQQRRLEHALIYSKLKLLPRHPSQIYATLQAERSQHLKESREREKRVKLLSSQLRCTQEECRQLQEKVQHAEQSRCDMKRELDNETRKLQQVQEKATKDRLEATRILNETKRSYDSEVRSLTDAHAQDIAKLEHRLKEAHDALEASKKKNIMCQLELLEIGERQIPSYTYSSQHSNTSTHETILFEEYVDDGFQSEYDEDQACLNCKGDRLL